MTARRAILSVGYVELEWKIGFWPLLSYEKSGFKEAKKLRGLSLGCGTGNKELLWAELGNFSVIDAIDISKPRVEEAARKAERLGYGDIVRYRVGDVRGVKLPASSYDVVFADSSLHHLSPLREILLKIDAWLAPAGLLVVNDFVGPTRFQWTDRQLEAANALLSLLPMKYKTLPGGGEVRSRIYRPSRLHMILSDPSEAVESSSILPCLHEIFEVLEMREYGGTVLHLLFADIAHNFISAAPEDKRWLELCFRAEDLLLAEGDLSSDFIVAVCRKRP